MERSGCNALHLQDFKMTNPYNISSKVCNMSRCFFLFMITIQVLFILLTLPCLRFFWVVIDFCVSAKRNNFYQNQSCHTSSSELIYIYIYIHIYIYIYIYIYVCIYIYIYIYIYISFTVYSKKSARWIN